MAKPLSTHCILERSIAGSRWLVEHQNTDGGWKGLRNSRVDAFYKSCWSLMETGHSAATHRALTHLRQHFLTPNGDFSGRGHPRHTSGHYPYINSYIIIGSMLASRYDIAIPALSFLLTQQAAHGGFFSQFTSSGRKEMADTASSAIAGIACLSAGRLEEARRVAGYLSHMINLQPALHDRFFTTLRSDGRLYTEPDDNHDALLRIIDTKATEQCWFTLGLPFAFLILLADAAQDTRYLELARRYFDFQDRCSGSWDSFSSGKAAWGCAMLYRITGEARYRDIAMHIAKNITAKQETNGNWLSKPGGQQELTNADFDLTAEFTLWLSLIYTHISAQDSGRIPIVFTKINIPKPKSRQTLQQTLKRTARAHYIILSTEGLRKYLQRSYSYRKGQILRIIKKGTGNPSL